MKGFRLLLLLFATGCLMSTVGAEQNGTIIPHLSFHFGVKRNPPGDRMLPRVARHIVFSSDSTEIISKLEDGRVERWDLETRNEKYVTTTKDLFGYSPTRNLLLIRKENDDVTLIALDTNQETVLTNGGFENGGLSANGKFVALSRGDKEIEIWEINQKRLLKRLKTIEQVRNGLAISGDGQYVAAAEGTYRDGEGHRTKVEVWDIKQDTSDLIDTGVILGVWNLHFSPDASMLAVDSQIEAKAGIRVWDRSTRKQLFKRDFLKAYWARAVTFVSEGKYIALGDESGVIGLWNIKKNKEVLLMEIVDAGIESLAFSHDGKYMAVGLFDSTVQIWELKSDL